MASDRKIGRKLIGAAIFILMEIAALGMLKNGGELQEAWISRASHGFSAKVWGGCEEIRHYFLLNKENRSLAEENFRLSEELRSYRSLENISVMQALADSLHPGSDFSYIPAEIVKISRNKQHNYFILNKGYEDGVIPQSGVITANGVVGIIDAVEKHYSYGLSLMNTGVNISARLGTEGAVGPLTWDGISSDGAVLKEIPLQFKYAPGDTVWTSGFSTIFPPDIPIGTTGKTHLDNGACTIIEVELFQDFSALRHVILVENPERGEIQKLEQQ